jgi:hypothetical protein
MTTFTQTFTDKQKLAVRLTVGVVFGSIIAFLSMAWTTPRYLMALVCGASDWQWGLL